MNNKKSNIQNRATSESSTPRDPLFESDPLFARLEGTDADFGKDIISFFKSIDAFRDAKDDRVLENIIRQRLTGKLFILENMGQSEFYNRPKAISRTIPSRQCLSQDDMETKGLKQLSSVTYTDAEKLNRMWNTYATTFLEVSRGLMASIKTSEAKDPFEFTHDFLIHHFELVGATIEVVHSQNLQLIGITGVVLRENENSLELISASNKRRLIPKDVVTIRVHILGSPGLVLRGPELAGTGRSGSVYRASKKSQSRRAKNSLSYS